MPGKSRSQVFRHWLALWALCTYALFSSPVPVYANEAERDAAEQRMRAELEAAGMSEEQIQTELEAMRDSWLEKSDFSEAARMGVEASGTMYRASYNNGMDGLRDTADGLRDTSENIHAVGQVSKVTSYAGYATGVASIGSLMWQHAGSETSETAVAVGDVASKAALGVGTVNMGTGIYTWAAARRFETVGAAAIDEYDANGDSEELQQARQKFLAARARANKAAYRMMINGGANIAAGAALMAFGKEVKDSQQDMGTLGESEEDPAADGGASGPAASGSAPVYFTNQGGGGTETSSGGSITTIDPDSGAPDGSGVDTNGIANNLIDSGGASIAPTTRSQRRQLAGLRRAKNSGNSDSAAAGAAPGGLGSGTLDSDAETDTLAEEITEADPLKGEVAYSQGGGTLSMSGAAPDETNPMANVLGQLGGLFGKKDGKGNMTVVAGDNMPGQFAMGSARNVASEGKVDREDQTLFQIVKAKYFQMKFRGNL